MTDHSRQLVDKLWNFCNLLRDDGLSYGDYVEQLTYLLFLKMAHERTQPPFSQESRVPAGLDWPSLLTKDGPELEAQYVRVLRELGREGGTLGLIFRKAQNRIQDPAKLKRLIVDLIDAETWGAVDADVKGDAYEGLLEKNASDTKTGAGQYFTPRALIKAIVDVMQPSPGRKIGDPCCGTGGFLLAAHDYIATNNEMDRDEKIFLRDKAFFGTELVDNTARLCAMNLFLHGVGSSEPDAEPPITVGDALVAEPSTKADMVLTNPPFGRKSSMTMVADDGKTSPEDMTIARQDFWATTSNKQLNFVQHIRSMLKVDGSAAIVLPDNVLFEGGAGEKIRRRLLEECNVHTILRLPTGIFYAQGVKANVVFLERHGASSQAATKELWIYDFRTNRHFTLKTRTLKRSDLNDFVDAYKPGRPHERQESGCFKRYQFDELKERPGFNLDLWAELKDDSLEDVSSLPAPEVIAEEIVENLTSALEQFQAIAEMLGGNGVNGGTSAADGDAVEKLLPDDEHRI
ncbi:MAG: type I restriction-modification system subunit M [Actinomycetota bacterium]|nr:type I restriction-modification system subunit M [Actinomycetota bacterium]